MASLIKKRSGLFFDNYILCLLQNRQNVLIVAHGNSLRGLLVHLQVFDEKTIE